MSFEYKIKIKEKFEYPLFLNSLVDELKEINISKDVRIVDNSIEITDKSSWGRCFELYLKGSDINFWINANKKEREVIINAIEKILAMQNISMNIVEL